MKPFEKWLYPSMLLWLAAALWVFLQIVPQGRFVPVADFVVGVVLTAAAAGTAVVALILSYGR